MNIAIFGGSFDPLHNGHLCIAKQSLKQLNIKQLIVIPTYISLFKNSYFVDPDTRFKVTKNVFSSFKNIFVSDFEKNKQKATSTYESVMYIRKKFKTNKIYIVVGADNIENIHLWKNYKKLNAIAKFVVAPRNKIKINKNKYIILKCMDKNSSSDIRDNKYFKNIPIKTKMIKNHNLQDIIYRK